MIIFLIFLKERGVESGQVNLRFPGLLIYLFIYLFIYLALPLNKYTKSGEPLQQPGANYSGPFNTGTLSWSLNPDIMHTDFFQLVYV